MSLRKQIYNMMTLLSPKLNTRVLYRLKFGKKWDEIHPITLNDKILYLKYHQYWNNSTIAQCADKFAVRKYLENAGFGDLLNELLGVYEFVEDIPWEKLPNQFALKLDVGCGCNIICTDKKNLDIESTKRTLKKWLKSEYWKTYAEMQYKDVKKYILIEKYLGSSDGVLPVDYKFYCFNGKAKYVMTCVDREIGKKAKYIYFDRNWNMMPFSQDALDFPELVVPKPILIERAFEIAEQISKSFPFVRTDLYIVDGKVYFGEFTFTPAAGLDRERLSSTDKLLGEELLL